MRSSLPASRSRPPALGRTSPGPSIVWFRQDLRLRDHAALTAAASRGEPVIPVYIWSPEEEGRWPPGAASRVWLHHSLERLDASLRALGSRLVLRRGPARDALLALARECGARNVFYHRRYEPAARAVQDDIRGVLEGAGIHAHEHAGTLLHEPESVLGRSGRPFQVFTPFWNHCLSLPEPGTPSDAPGALPPPRRWPPSLPLESFHLQPRSDWTAGIRAAWEPGEEAAMASLRRFTGRTSRSRAARPDAPIAHYASRRDTPEPAGVSRLSPYLHHGELSARQVYHAARRAGGAEAYLRQLGWREFAYHLLFHFPHMPERPLRPEFAGFPWIRDKAALTAWQRGRTGVPLVDAGMRELWTTGWMHNRVRMVAASFLVKHLLISWHRGADWFWDTLVDADLANNTLGWQWVAGCGADAAPYFRIFNPFLQSRRFDPEGRYVERWIPELRAVPVRSPGAPGALSGQAEHHRNTRYPAPIVDHALARGRALAAYNSWRTAPRRSERGASAKGGSS